MLMMLYKTIFHFPCLEKMAKAFFKMSRSSLRSFTCFLKLWISSSGAFNLPCPGKAYSGSSEYYRIQRCRRTGWIPKLFATSVTLPSLCFTNWIASILNSLVNLLLVLFESIWTPLLFHFNNLNTNLTGCPLKCSNIKVT